MCLMCLLGDVSETSRRRTTTIRNPIKCCLLNYSSRRRKQQHIRCFLHHHSPHQVSFKSITMFSSSFLRLVLLLCLVSSSFSTASPSNSTAADQTLRPQEELQKLKLIRQELQKINKPAVKTIQAISIFSKFVNMINAFRKISLLTLFSVDFLKTIPCRYSVFLLCFLLCFFSLCVMFMQSSDGDTIDCVLSHQQPAFDHPLLQGQRPMVNYFSIFFGSLHI